MFNHRFSAFLIVRFNYSTARSLAVFCWGFFAAFILFLELTIKSHLCQFMDTWSN